MRPSHVIAAAACAAAIAHAQTFQLLGTPTPGYHTIAFSVSADGSVVAANTFPPGGGVGAGYRWTAAAGWGPVGLDLSQLKAVSADGTTLVGAVGDPVNPNQRIVIWRPPASPQVTESGNGLGVSSDGAAVLGTLFATGDAFRWTESGGYQHLDHYIPASIGYAVAQSLDGSIIAGYEFWSAGPGLFTSPVMWNSAGVRELPWAGPVEGISADGRDIVGTTTIGYQGPEQALLWSQAQGPQFFRILPGYSESAAYGISADGSVVIEQMRSSADGHWDGMLWDRALGTRDLRQVLAQNGAPEALGYVLQPRGISGDGRTIVGCASLIADQTHWQAFIARIPAFCYANCDGSAAAPALNINDFVCFQTRYARGDPYANCDRSNTPPLLNINDYLCFMTKFAKGCE